MQNKEKNTDCVTLKKIYVASTQWVNMTIFKWIQLYSHQNEKYRRSYSEGFQGNFARHLVLPHQFLDYFFQNIFPSTNPVHTAR